jgi:hypothetical protein
VLREAVLSRSLDSVTPTLYAILKGVLQRIGFGTLKVQILASVVLLFFVSIRYLILNHLQLNNRGSMDDGNNNEVSWQDRFLAWAVQLFEFVWNGASGAVAVGVIFVKPSAWVDRGQFFVPRRSWCLTLREGANHRWCVDTKSRSWTGSSSDTNL